MNLEQALEKIEELEKEKEKLREERKDNALDVMDTMYVYERKIKDLKRDNKNILQALRKVGILYAKYTPKEQNSLNGNRPKVAIID